MSRHQNAGRNHNLMIADKFFEHFASSNVWERPQQIRIAFTKKLRAD